MNSFFLLYNFKFIKAYLFYRKKYENMIYIIWGEVKYENVIENIKDNEITLEVCPTSNIQTCICNSYESHPISRLYFNGVKTTINTDNMTVSNTTLEKEYENLIENTKLTIEDIIKMNINSINAAFISESEKKELIKKVKDYNMEEE